MDSLTLILRFIGVAQLAIIACLAVRDLSFSLVGYLVAVFCFGVASYLICPIIAVHGELGPLDVVIYFGCFGMPIFFLDSCRSASRTAAQRLCRGSYRSPCRCSRAS